MKIVKIMGFTVFAMRSSYTENGYQKHIRNTFADPLPLQIQLPNTFRDIFLQAESN